MTLTFEQIQDVVKNNPHKAIIKKGREISSRLQLHVEGVGMEDAIKKCEHFADPDIYAIQKQYAMSNVDVFARLLQQEDMVFMSRGGSSYFKMSDSDEQAMNSILNEIEFGMSLRKWIKTFALQAYRVDPMGVIFMEVDQLKVDSNGVMNMPRAYPTYKSIFSIHDYKTTGRKLEYICFRLTNGEARQFGISHESLKNTEDQKESFFYRIVDDKKDLIVMFKDNDQVSLVTTEMISQKNPLANYWKRTPGFIVSDMINYKNPSCYLSPLHNVVELADTFLQDRSIRDLQKKFHGFAKAVEPLLQCGACSGTKYVDGLACKTCTPPGSTEPTGFKLKTKISDVARFPLEILEKGSFDFAKIFGYVTPPIDSWNKQDDSLDGMEQLMEMTYWGTIRIKRPSTVGGLASNEPITATESTSNDAPKEARLNMTADWAEKSETLVADFMGEFWFPDKFKQASISYGRDYILKTPEQLMEAYQNLITKGSPDFSKDEALEKYYQAKYQNNPTQLAKYIKMLNVEPFPHDTVANIEKSSIIPFPDKVAKRYFGEWADTIPDIKWVVTPAATLIQDLKNFVTAKALTEPKPEPIGNPAFN